MAQAIKSISNLRFALGGIAFGVLFSLGFFWLRYHHLPTLLEFLVIAPLMALAFGLSMRLVLQEQLKQLAEMEPAERQKAMNKKLIRTLLVIGSFWALALALKYL